MNLTDLTQRLHADHFSSPQACLTISTAVAEVEHGLALLARLGHVFHLEAGPPYHLPEWPRILFHVESAPNGRVVNSWWEANDLGPGWWPTLSEAQQREGIRAQFAGRGGIGDRSLPMLVDGGPAGPRPDWGPKPKDNGDLIEEWKRSIEGVRSAGEGSWGNVTIHDDRAAAASGAGNDGVAAAPDSSQSLSGQLGLGDLGPGGNGAEAGLCNTGAESTNRVSEDAVPGNTVSDSQERNRGIYDNLGRILASSGRTLADARTARRGES